MTNIHISIVIPLYNKQNSIAATLQSVFAQTYTDYEVIVVDDGSTDDSFVVAKQVIGERSEVRGKVIQKANGGVSSARNAGIMAASGEYIAFLDGDDLWHPEYLATLHQLIVDYPDAAIYGIGFSTMVGDEIPKVVEPSTMRGELLDVWNNYPGFWTGSSSSSSSSRARLIEIGLFDTRMTHGEDIDMWWRLLLSGKGVIDNRVLAYYRQDTENRAMNRAIPLEKHIPYYIDKYAEARANNIDFRRYFDREMIYRLYPYMFDARYKQTAQKLAKQMDYRLQKWTMRFRMVCPHVYRTYEKVKRKI